MKIRPALQAKRVDVAETRQVRAVEIQHAEQFAVE